MNYNKLGGVKKKNYKFNKVETLCGTNTKILSGIENLDIELYKGLIYYTKTHK